MLLTFVGISGCPLSGSESPSPYACGDASNSHCYAKASLSGPVTGFQTTLTLANASGGDHFLTNEFWIFGYAGNPYRGWIELGYVVRPSGRATYFLASNDPVTAQYQVEYIDDVPSDQIGSTAVFDIHQIADNLFSVSITSPTLNYTKTISISLWRANSGGYVQFGQELAGTNGARSSVALFTQNKIYDQTFSARFATASDLPGENIGRPPFGGWLSLPQAGNSGGVFGTYCCEE